MSAVEDGSFERWRGGVDERLRSQGARISEVAEMTGDNATRIGILEVTVGKLAVKLGVAAALGSLAGGAIVSFLVLYAGHHVH